MLAMLLSPVMMLIQSRFVLDVFLGRDSGWNTQNRDAQAIPFLHLLRRHWAHMATGAAFGFGRYGTLAWVLACVWILHLLGAMVALGCGARVPRFLALQAAFGVALAALVYPA